MSVSDPQNAGGLPRWRKSSYSGGGNDCVEVAGMGEVAVVRDSKNPDGGSLIIDRAGWAGFLAMARDGSTDR